MATSKTTVYEDSQTDFSGGILEQRSPSAFSNRSMALAKGFLFESEQVMRSQPACQRIGATSNFIAVRGYSASDRKYLIAITTSGQLQWAVAPPSDIASTTAHVLTWNNLSAPSNPAYRFLVDNDSMDLPDGRVNAVSISTAQPNSTGVKVYEGASGLECKTFTELYPADTLVNDVATPAENKFPPANQGAVLGSRLFLGDSLYSRDSSQPFSPSNYKQYSSGVWFSEADTDTFFALAYLYPASTEAQIRGMHVLDNRLILITTAGPASDGLLVLSGDFTGPAEASTLGEVSAKINLTVLRGGTGAPRQTTNQHRNYSSLWPETGTVCFVDRLGGVWSTEGQTVERIDQFGPQAPNLATENDHVAAMGKHLFVSRAGRLLVLTLLSTSSSNDDDTAEGSAAWTELVTPNAGAQVMSMSPLDDCLYFVSNGQLWRYTLASQSGSNERGLIDGAPTTLTFGTRTHGDPTRHDQKSWLRFAFRARPGQPGKSVASGSEARVTKVRIRPRPVLDQGSSYDQVPAQPLIQDRYQAVLNAGIGSQIEASAEIQVQGDVVLEEYSWTVNGVEPKR